MAHHFCDNGNRLCTPGNLCTPCSGSKRPLADGEGVTMRVGMMFMDSAQRAIAAESAGAREIRAQALADHEAWLRAGGHVPDQRSPEERAFHDQALASNRASNAYAMSNAARRQAVIDHHRGSAADTAYDEMCAQLQRGAR